MKFRMSKSYAFNTNDAKKEAEADAEFDCLYGQVHASHSATKGSKKPPKKATPPVGALQAVLAVLLEAHIMMYGLGLLLQVLRIRLPSAIFKTILQILKYMQ